MARFRPSGWWYPVGLVLIVAGFGALWSGIGRLDDRVAGLERVVVPGKRMIELHAGSYTVFYESRSVVDGTIYETGELSDLRCKLRRADGGEVALETPRMQTTYLSGATRGGRSSALTYRAPENTSSPARGTTRRSS